MTVYLVGAGPGDPGLLTLRGAELLARADVVVHDRLSAAELLDLAPTSAERIDVGKAPKAHRMGQQQINELLVTRGLAGQTVVRLKGGDPFVFARGSEEAAALAEAGVAYEVVPGITSALAVPAYAGIPVTQRFSSTSFTVVTGHEDPASGDGTVNWDAIARTGGTIVILMGVGRWEKIAAQLLDAGLDPDTPAAAVRWGSRPEQSTIRATLATLGSHPLAAPSVIVVGSVAAEDFDWFGGRALEDGTNVVAQVDIAVLRDAVAALAPGDWLVVSSRRGVDLAFNQVADTRSLSGVQIVAVGPEAANALTLHRVVPDLVIATGEVPGAPAPPTAGGHVLVVITGAPGELDPETFRAAGWTVDAVEVRASPSSAE